VHEEAMEMQEGSSSPLKIAFLGLHFCVNGVFRFHSAPFYWIFGYFVKTVCGNWWYSDGDDWSCCTIIGEV